MLGRPLMRYGPRQALSIGAVLVLAFFLSASVSTTAAPNSQTPPPSNPTPVTKPILLTDPVPDPHQEGVMWFAATGHTLRGEFLTYWQQYGGLAQFGYPLTEEFFEPVGPDNKAVQVQYFERNRFEHHPENTHPYDVLLSQLGRLRYDLKYGRYAAEVLSETPNTSTGSVLFPETGKRLGGAFLQYWQEHGDVAQFGYPITDEFQEKSDTDGRVYTIQYFERTEFELHPENAGSPYEVLLGLLGRQLSEKNGYPFGWYPLYGRAADWSWVSGRHIPRRSCALRICNCTFVSEFGTAIGVEPTGPMWEAISATNQVPQDGYVVLFGHLASLGETAPPICPNPGYIVDQFRLNPMP